MSNKPKGLNKCDKCESCKYCELIKMAKKLDDVCGEIVNIHNRTSDCVFSNQLMYQTAMDCKTLTAQFRMKVKQYGIEF